VGCLCLYWTLVAIFTQNTCYAILNTYGCVNGPEEKPLLALQPVVTCLATSGNSSSKHFQCNTHTQLMSLPLAAELILYTILLMNKTKHTSITHTASVLSSSQQASPPLDQCKFHSYVMTLNINGYTYLYIYNSYTVYNV